MQERKLVREDLEVLGIKKLMPIHMQDGGIYISIQCGLFEV